MRSCPSGRARQKDDVAELLQQHGIAAAPLRHERDLHRDPQLLARDTLRFVDHGVPVLGHVAHPFVDEPWRARGHERATLSAFRYNGQDNARVLRDWLGLQHAEVAELALAGALKDAGSLIVQDQAPQPSLHDPEHASHARLKSASP